GAGTKAGPYEVGLHVPLLVRGPGFEPGPALHTPSIVFQDLAATMLAIAGGTAGLPHQEGVPLTEMLQDPDKHKQRVLLHEVGQGFENQTGNGITTGPDNSEGFRKLYRYPSVTVAPNGPFTYEAYDLDKDPNELSNWANDRSRRAERDKLEAKLEAQLA